jgi:hypothetical protein
MNQINRTEIIGKYSTSYLDRIDMSTVMVTQLHEQHYDHDKTTQDI